MSVFRSSGRPGFSAAVAEDPEHVTRRKLEREVRARFADKYTAVPPTASRGSREAPATGSSTTATAVSASSPPWSSTIRMKSSARPPPAFHQMIQRLLLIGANVPNPPAPPDPLPPERVVPLIDAIAADHRRFDLRAVTFGNRYRSGFWSIYLLSAVAVLCAILPLALGWDDRLRAIHPVARIWTLAEVGVIATVSAIYWIGHKRDWQGQWLAARTTAEFTWYLPLIAPLVDFETHPEQINWYVQVFDLEQQDGGRGGGALRADPERRVHRISAGLLDATAVGALTQSEAYRLSTTSEGLAADLR